jgi:hypothetical protein
MKTTTYIFANGVTTKTISDQPELTPEQYASACAVIRKAASQEAYAKSKNKYEKARARVS